MIAYFNLGLGHILDLNAYDHVLFIAVLLCGVRYNDWKSLLFLISAFTIGHSLTLAVVVLHAPLLNAGLVEFLIPLTILLAAIANLVVKRRDVYFSAVFTGIFGLIHGMGFASYLKLLLPEGEGIWQALLMFNLGVEAGQLVFASLFMALLYGLRFVSNISVRVVQNAFSVLAIAISLFLAFSNWKFS